MPTGTVSKVRQIIKAEELIIKLQNNVLDDNAEPLHQNKLHAIKILLAKAIPDLKAVEHSGMVEGTVYIPVIKRFDGSVDESSD